MRTLALLTLTSLTLSLQPGSASRPLSLCNPGVAGVFFRAEKCYSPAEASRAEAQMPVPIVRPTTVVERIARIRLREVGVLPLPPPAGHAYPIARIDYLFGRLPRWFGNHVNWSAPHPLYVTVGELSPNESPGKPLFGRMGGQWVFSGHFPSGNLSVRIESNEPGWIVRRIGLRLLHLKPQVKGPGKG